MNSTLVFNKNATLFGLFFEVRHRLCIAEIIERKRGWPNKIGIVALARKLLVELWKYLETGVIPEGAVVA